MIVNIQIKRSSPTICNTHPTCIFPKQKLSNNKKVLRLMLLLGQLHASLEHFSWGAFCWISRGQGHPCWTLVSAYPQTPCSMESRQRTSFGRTEQRTQFINTCMHQKYLFCQRKCHHLSPWCVKSDAVTFFSRKEQSSCFNNPSPRTAPYSSYMPLGWIQVPDQTQ